ncbi:unnamed protein product, partial [Polarella glacialis]
LKLGGLLGDTWASGTGHSVFVCTGLHGVKTDRGPKRAALMLSAAWTKQRKLAAVHSVALELSPTRGFSVAVTVI